MDEATRIVLEARARRYAEAPAEVDPGQAIGAYAGCRVGGVVLGLPVSVVHEFAPLRHWTPLRGRRGLLGVTHLRGDVMGLLDLLESLCGRRSGDCDWMVVLEGRGGRAASPVSEVLGMRELRSRELLPAEQAPLLGPGIAAVTHDLWFLVDAAAVQAALEGAEERAGPPPPAAPPPPPDSTPAPRKPRRRAARRG